MNWSASVLSTVSSDTEPTLVINFDTAKYIFNVGENTSRSWLQARRNWRKARGIFLTSVGTKRCTGLPGLLMFFADAQMPRMDVVGPPGLTHYLASMRSFLWRSQIAVKTVDAPASPSAPVGQQPDPVYRDSNISVFAIPLYTDAPGSVYFPHVWNSSVQTGDKRKRSPSPYTTSKRPAPSTADGDDSAAATTELVTGSILDRLLAKVSVPGFSPYDLHEEEAEEWRRLVLSSMFPYVEPPPEPKPAEMKQKGKKAADAPPAEAAAPAVPGENPGAGPGTPNNAIPRALHHALRYTRLPLFSHQDANGESHAPPTLCYVVVGPRVRGKFDVQKAEALGLGRGPQRGRLTKGETVTVEVDDGNGNKIQRVIRPEDCIGPSESPRAVIVLDVPTPAHIDPLIKSFSESAFYSRYHSQSDENRAEHPVELVVHMCGQGVLEDPRYKDFMNGFSKDTNQLVASREHTPDPLTFTSFGSTQLRLNQLDPELFPLPHFRLDAARPLASVPGLPPKTQLLRSNITVGIRPPVDPTIDPLSVEDDKFHPVVASGLPLSLTSSSLEIFAEAKRSVEQRHADNAAPPKPGDDVLLVPLGTSSSLPSKFRNVLSTLVQIPGWGNVLLDAGEGTWGQLTRAFGDDPSCVSGVWQILRELKCIYISHVHGDHHIGLARILAMRQRLQPQPAEPLYVIAPSAVMRYIREQSDVEDLGVDRPENGVVTVPAAQLNWKETYKSRMHAAQPFISRRASWNAVSDMCQSLGIERFTTVDVVHGGQCYGCVIKHKDGWTLVFSGDTIPTDNLVSAGAGATVLIHEATLGDDQEEMAKAKQHSTFSQAVDIGRRMNAEKVLLTHFSARYPKMPPSVFSENSFPLAIALDFARMKIGDLWKFNAYLPAIEHCFEETAEEGDEDEVDLSKVSW
ncbi:hypothetical protein OBBRIDRAFT_790349 [Obba rivulosa]|uniref:ribonuclease Z n=1 Tax=Obba rivulosa TaxID=1052685 RepID=A0A8E2DPE4_9APHY|nr:hypothetical protein OBBRIDRAFT_790349 [Obba rivulosa]